MISVSEALERLFALAPEMPAEIVPLSQASGRVLAEPVAARRMQPPFDASAMDGYAVAEAAAGDRFTVTGEAVAGRRLDGTLQAGEAVRIFTGAPLPSGATRVVIQEDVTRDGDRITVTTEPDTARHVRAAGSDFGPGHTVSAPRRLGPNDIALLAAMNVPAVPVRKRPVVAILATGDELVMPGEAPGADQIVASNTFGLHALMHDLGADPRMLPIARDNVASLRAAFGMIDDADLLLTVGGASVGDHDLVAPVAADLGMAPAFHKVAMRPGKPLMSGRLGETMMIGLPGNPVSAMVCGHVFVAPVLRSMLGLDAAPAPRCSAPLAAPLRHNGPREHYMRATLSDGALTVFDRQDSSLLSVLAAADALVVRPPWDTERQAGDVVQYLPL